MRRLTWWAGLRVRPELAVLPAWLERELLPEPRVLLPPEQMRG